MIHNEAILALLFGLHTRNPPELAAMLIVVQVLAWYQFREVFHAMNEDYNGTDYWLPSRKTA